MTTANKSVVRFEIEPRSIALILATVAGVWLAYRLWIVALVLVIALILAGTFNPLVEWLEARRITRPIALGLVFAGASILAGGLLFLTVPSLIEQVTQIVQNAPATQARLISLLNARRITSPLAHIVQGVELKPMFAAIEKDVIGSAAQIARVAGYGATALVLSVYLLADGKRVQGVVYALVPRDFHMRLARILQNLEVIVGGYVRGQFITSASIAVFTLALLLALRVPNALPLAVCAGVADVIPFIGGFLIVIPAMLSALPQGWGVAGTVMAALMLYMEFESRVLVPRIYGHVLRLSSTVVILALVAGGTLLGVMGALLALPIAAGLQMMIEELRVEMPGDDSVNHTQLAKHARDEATYEQMSAGATAPDAGEIAKKLAHEIRDADLATATKTP